MRAACTTLLCADGHLAMRKTEKRTRPCASAPCSVRFASRGSLRQRRHQVECKAKPVVRVNSVAVASPNRGGQAESAPSVGGFGEEERVLLTQVEAALGRNIPSPFFFTDPVEIWTGRTAMIGFTACALVDIYTGKGVLQQLGFTAPDPAILSGILSLFGSSLVLSTIWTFTRFYSGKMKVGELKEYCTFLRLDANSIRCVPTRQAEWLPLGLFDVSDATKLGNICERNFRPLETEPLNPSTSETKSTEPLYWLMDEEVEKITTQEDLEEAREFELLFARSAMVGFAACLIVEAATGNGLVSQIRICAEYLA